MAVFRSDIERALDELASQEEGMRFQDLAVVLGKTRWPELIARPRKKDFGLDAYAGASLTPQKVGKGLAASITPTLKKILSDAKTAKQNFPDLRMLLFVTCARIGNADRRRWEEDIHKELGIELTIVEREEIIAQMMMPANASLRASYLHLSIDAEPQLAELIERTKRAADIVSRAWAVKTRGHPLIELRAVRLETDNRASNEVWSLEQIDEALLQSRRIVLEGPAGRGKTTTLTQLAQRARTHGTPIIVELPTWTASRQGILAYLAGRPAFQAEGLTAANLARVQQAERFLLLLNGWNEIAESTSVQATEALRELERDFPSAGIIVATRTHHLVPPLPGAVRLRLLPLRRAQRAEYLAARLGAASATLRERIDGDPSLDELTRAPFILSEVTSLFEAGADIPGTKLGILAEVLRLHERRAEHQNALQGAPIFGCQAVYLKALAVEMTRRGAVALPELDARSLIADVVTELANRGQVEPTGAPAVLATLTAHHVVERIEPQTAFQFEHQQLQEYYATLDVSAGQLELPDGHDATATFIAEYVNKPAWDEPLRMIAEHIGDRGSAERETRTGAKLVEMALAVDPVFAGELARLCGPAVWNEVRATLGESFRSAYATGDHNHRHIYLAAMLATGAEDFKDIILPLLSGQDQQTRLHTYRIRPDIRVSSLGSHWRAEVRSWSEKARADFVSELLHHHVDTEVAAFAAEDDSAVVKKAAGSALLWNGAEDALSDVAESMDAQTFLEFARQHADLMPAMLKRKTIATLRTFIENTADHSARLRAGIDLIGLGETGLDGVVRDALAALPGDAMRNMGQHYIQPALEYLRTVDPTWASEWVATRIAKGDLFDHDYWLRFTTTIPDSLVESYLRRLETEHFKNTDSAGMSTVIAARASASLAARILGKILELRRKVDGHPTEGHAFERAILNQLETLFRRLPGDVAAAGVLSSVTGEVFDITVATNLLGKVARPGSEPMRIADDELKAGLRTYLKRSVDLVLSRDDFNGDEKANLASSIAQVGNPDDMADLIKLVRADIERMRRGLAARAAGDRGPLGNGGTTSYAPWHIAAITHLDPAGADQVLIDLLPEPEYGSNAAAAMARDFAPKRERSYDSTIRYDLMWAAREGRIPLSGDAGRRTKFAVALKTEIKRLRELNQDGNLASRLNQLAKALAAIDGRGSAAEILELMVAPGQRDEYAQLEAAELLLMAGVCLPASSAFALLDSLLQRTERWMQDSDKNLLRRILALCPLVDDPPAGVAKIREVLGARRFWGHELRELVTALGESRSEAAADLLFELASDEKAFGQIEDVFFKALAALDTPRARELLLGFVDPDVHGIVLNGRPHREDFLVVHLEELARREPKVTARLLELCERDLPERNRFLLSKVMASLGTPETLVANLNLIDDAKPSAIPRGIWDQLESAFVERRPSGSEPNGYTLHPRTSNELRVRLFWMLGDPKRRVSALTLLGQVEVWRLEYGKPPGEPRHPVLASGRSWPPRQPDVTS